MKRITLAISAVALSLGVSAACGNGSTSGPLKSAPPVEAGTGSSSGSTNSSSGISSSSGSSSGGGGSSSGPPAYTANYVRGDLVPSSGSFRGPFTVNESHRSRA